MASKNISPEKRLLEIIEGKHTPELKPRPAAMGIASPGAWKARWAFMQERLRTPAKGAKKKRGIEIRAVNRMLQFLLIIAVIGMGANINIQHQAVTKGAAFTAAAIQPDTAAQAQEIASPLQPESYYLEIIARRNIFDFGDVPQSPVKFKEDDAAVSKLSEMIKSLRLVGISWSDNPDAMIENTVLKKTYFVQKGSMIDEMKVKDILVDRVIVQYQMEEMDLR